MTGILDNKVQILFTGKLDRLLNVFNALDGDRIVRDWHEFQQLELTQKGASYLIRGRMEHRAQS
jgi:hypothetical protein